MKRVTFPAKLLIGAIFFLFSTLLHAADYYWVGGSGNWSDYSHHWATASGGSTFQTRIPLSIDNVFFDEASFTTTGQTVTVDIATAQALNMSWTGVTNAPAFLATTDKTLKLSGSLTLVPAMNFGFGGVVYFVATTKGQTITSAGQAFQNEVYFQGTGGEWILQDDFTVVQGAPVADIRFYAGTLNTNNKTLTTPRLFSYDFGNPRLLNLTSSLVVVTGQTWEYQSSGLSGNTVDGDSATISFPNGGTFKGGNGNTYFNMQFGKSDGTGPGTIGDENTRFNGQVIFYSLGRTTGYFNKYYGSVSFYNTAYFVSGNDFFYGSVYLLGNGVFSGNNHFNNLSFSPGNTYTLESGATQYITGELSANGTGAKPITIQANTPGQVALIAKNTGTVCLDYVWMSDIDGYGSAVFNAGKSPERSLDLGNNPGWVFTGGCSAIVLPLALSSFTTSCLQNGGTQLKWHTQTEKNVSHFSVEKSNDGLSFNTVAILKAGNNTDNDYGFVDNNARLGKAYYRLKQTDSDGGFTYSTTVAVDCKEAINKVQIYPNPTNGFFSINAPKPFAEMRLTVYNAVGNKVYENTWQNNKTVDVNLSSFPKGIYYLSLLVDKEEKREKLIIQ